jgi:hypothetical protein
MKSYFIMFLIILIFSYSASCFATPNALEPVGRVVWVKGGFQAIQPNQAPRTLTQNAIIFLHDTLSTEEKSQAQIVFTDNTVMTFRENTKLYVDHYSFDPHSKKTSVGTYLMDLIEGGFRTITGLIAKNNPADYSVNTPVATIGVRGTDYEIVYDVTTGALYIKKVRGKPRIDTGWGSLLLEGPVEFAQVPGRGKGPIRLMKVPSQLRFLLKLVPVTITPFQSIGNDQFTGGVIIPASMTNGGDGTSSTLIIGPPSVNTPSSSSGTVSGFCIK